MTAAEDTGHIVSVAIAVVFACAFLIAPGVWIVADEFRLRRLRRAHGTIVPLDRTTLTIGSVMLAAGLADVAVRILS